MIKSKYSMRIALKSSRNGKMKKTTTGKWAMGKEGGDFKGKARVKGDQFCYTVGGQKERCNVVYQDGADIYEVNPKGVVTSKNNRN